MGTTSNAKQRILSFGLTIAFAWIVLGISWGVRATRTQKDLEGQLEGNWINSDGSNAQFLPDHLLLLWKKEGSKVHSKKIEWRVDLFGNLDVRINGVDSVGHTYVPLDGTLLRQGSLRFSRQIWPGLAGDNYSRVR